jgi:apolipoprotein N-acyltransferase
LKISLEKIVKKLPSGKGPGTATTSGGRIRRGWRIGLALLSAGLLLLSFPSLDRPEAAWVALAPLLLAVGGGEETASPRWAFGLGWLTGIIWIFFAENWIAHSMIVYGQFVTVLAYGVALLFAAILAIFPGLFALAMRELVRSFGWMAFGAAPIVWVAGEWLRQAITGVTWNAIGISQVGQYRVARLAQYGGVYLVSAEVVALSAILVLVIRLRQRSAGRVAVLLGLAATLLYFLPSTAQPVEGETGAVVRVGGIQPNLPPDGTTHPERLGEDLENHLRLTRETVAARREGGGGLDLMVWAESPLSLFHDTDPVLRELLAALAKETGAYLIINGVGREGEAFFNSLHLIDPRPTQALESPRRYDKMRLVPFGEYVPFRAILGRFVPAITGDFQPGEEAVVHLLRLETERTATITDEAGEITPKIERTTNFVRVGGFICYEAAYPDLVRQFVRNGATLLVNISNDAWFGETAGPRQHLAHARMRAIETDRDLIRVTNSGISALLTADGRVVDPLPSFITGTQIWEAQARRSQTIYVRHGDWFAISSTLLTFALLGGSIWRRSRRAPLP